MTLRLGAALAAVALLGGCGIFNSGDRKPRTPVIGERIAILTAEAGAEVDASLADVPVTWPAVTSNADWPQPGGSAEKALGHVALGPTPSRAWTASVAGSSPKERLAAAPTVGGGRVYVVDVNATLHAFDARSGGRAWSVALNTDRENQRSAFGGGASFDDGRVYATTGTGSVVAVNADTGAVLWRVQPGGPLRGAPTIANGQIYVVAQDNQLFALNPADGATQWTVAGAVETANVFGVAAPAAASGSLVAGFSSGDIYAYRYENGRVLWQDALSRTSVSTTVGTLTDIDASPVIDAGRVYAIGQGGRMAAWELNSGQRLWELNVAGIATPWLAGDWIFQITDDARLLCIQRTSGKIRWITQLKRWRNEKKRTGPISWTAPVLAGDRLILGNSQGQMINVAPADGAVGATTDLGAPLLLQPVVAGGTLFVLTNDGRLSAWR